MVYSMVWQIHNMVTSGRIPCANKNVSWLVSCKHAAKVRCHLVWWYIKESVLTEAALYSSVSTKLVAVRVYPNYSTSPGKNALFFNATVIYESTSRLCKMPRADVASLTKYCCEKGDYKSLAFIGRKELMQ